MSRNVDIFSVPGIFSLNDGTILFLHLKYRTLQVSCTYKRVFSDLNMQAMLRVYNRLRRNDDDDHVDGVRLRLWIAATNRPIVHPLGDIWAWRTMVEWHRQGKTFVHQSPLAVLPTESSTSKLGELGEGNYKFGLTKYLCSYFEGIFNIP
jgi:hypothetical protein